ncbi:chloramphenicol phosphotransferase CPT family protein [Rhizobium sp. RHZ01]|nr:chloramphenicol phosphotransferase CPT family protein [Rhizobium sp. RHZ01]
MAQIIFLHGASSSGESTIAKAHRETVLAHIY